MKKQKYYIITLTSEEPILLSYIRRNYVDSLIKRTKKSIKIYIPEQDILNPREFCSLVNGTADKKTLTIVKAHVPAIEKLSLYDYVSLLFDASLETEALP